MTGLPPRKVSTQRGLGAIDDTWRTPTAYPLACDAADRVGSWFKGAGLGLFVHWDHASQDGLEISWPLVGGNKELPGPPVPHAADYYRSVDQFDPQGWDPVDLATRAKHAGATYAVFTARHHSGWSAWPSKASDLTIASSPYGKQGGDLVREFLDAFRREGFKVGLYYSLSDWHHSDYPAWTDEKKPYGPDKNPIESHAAWDQYRGYVKAQLRELLTWYGDIDLLWFDGEWERAPEQWDTSDLAHHVRDLAPDIVINDRLYGQGDYRTPEQFIPPNPLAEPWECCMTMCDSWAYVPSDRNYKSIHETIRTLVEVTSRGGNLLLNVGPTGNGELVPEQRELLAELAAWMDAHKESTIGVGSGLEAWQYDGQTTTRGSRVYLHLLSRPVETIIVRGIPAHRIAGVSVLASGQQLDFRVRTSIEEGRSDDPIGELSIAVPTGGLGGLDPVLALDFSTNPNAATHKMGPPDSEGLNSETFGGGGEANRTLRPLPDGIRPSVLRKV